MGALAHFIEAAGIATTQISLIRLHTETIKPPRALWVPFELGRPLGVPDDAAFQHRVLAAALELLNRQQGPVLEDFAEEAPDAAADDMDGWVCPMPVRPSAAEADDPAAPLLAEIASLQQWHGLFRERRGRTSVGVCPLDIKDIARYLAGTLAQGHPGQLEGELEPATVLKHGCEDLKAFYSEAALAMPGNKSARQIDDWLWQETEAGRTLHKLKRVCVDSDDPKLQQIGNFTMVPHHRMHETESVQ